MAAYPLDKQAAGCSSSYNWLMSLAMDLAALCDVWRSENGTNGYHLAGFSEDVALPATSWLPVRPPPSHHIEVVLVLATPVKNLSKWWEIQLAIHPIVGG